MTNNWNKNKKEYLEALKRKGEIEFNYNNHYYHIESADYKSDDFNIWMFTSFESDDGKIIARCKNPAEVLRMKVFDGKSLEEIEDQMTDCYIL